MEFLEELASALPSAVTAEAPVTPETPAAEPVIETPVVAVTPETPAVVNTAETPVETPDVKPWYETQEAPVAQTTTTTTTQAVPEVEIDPELKLIQEWKKAGKSLADFVKEYQPVDYNTMSPEQIYKMGLNDLGVTGEEDVSTAMAEFETMPTLQRAQLIAGLREKYNSTGQERLKQLLAPVEATNAKTQQIIESYNNEVQKIGDSWTNKNVYGVTVTAEMAQGIATAIKNNEFGFQNNDGTFNVEKMAEAMFVIKHLPTIVKVNVAQAKTEGKKEVLAAVTNPSKNNTSAEFTANPVDGDLQATFDQKFKNN